MARREFSKPVKAEIVRRAISYVACAVSGCEGNANRAARGSRGWCVTHYTRWRRYGDPMATRNRAKGEARRYYETVVLPYDGEHCLLWPFGRYPSGYGFMHSADGTDRVSRAVCEDVNGPAPTDAHQAAHSCGNGHLGCVSKRHLSWKTPLQNQSDRFAHGTNLDGSRHPGAKLTDQDVREIRAMGGCFTRRELGDRFGVSKTTISYILLGKTWGSVK